MAFATGLGPTNPATPTGLATASNPLVTTLTDSSGSFTLKGTADGLGSAYLYDVAVDGNGKVLAATNSGLSMSANAGASFTAVTLPGAPQGAYASGATWYIPTSLGLAISTDVGATWSLQGDAAGVPAPAKDAWFSP